MCGIYGMILNEGGTVREELLRQAVALLKHRGPDGDGIYISPDRRIGLAHTRLAIVGVDNGSQPMANAAGNIWLAYNGEIFNHRELRQELEAEGRSFKTNCDTEVLLQLYDRDRSACLDQLSGMFAFVAYDERTKTVFGARDRLGKKPLFYLERPEGLYFSSEIWPLLKTPGYTLEIDLAALQQYFNYYLPLAPLTMLKGIKKLPPACSFRYDKGRMRIEQYWQPDYTRKRTEPEAELLEECQVRLQGAVKSRLMSEVPLGCMLSGGIDSSAVAALAQRELGNLRTFSAFYEDAAGRDIDYDYAQLVAEHIGSKHENLFYSAKDLLRELPDTLRAFGEPYGSYNGTISLAISRLMKQHVTVALSGNGGDETFAGYNTYRKVAMLDNPLAQAALKLIPALPFRAAYEKLSRGFPSFDSKWLLLYFLAQRNKMGQGIAHSESFFRQRLFSAEAAEQMPKVEDALIAIGASAKADTALDRWLYGDLMGRMQENMVLRSDFTGMAVGLEIRAPLLDHKLVEFAASLPADLRLKDGKVGKHLLREAVRPILPAAIFNRPKQGFSGITYAQLIAFARGEWKEFMGDLLMPDKPAPLSAGLFCQDGIEAIWQELQTGDAANPRTVRAFQIIWMLASLRQWERMVVEG